MTTEPTKVRMALEVEFVRKETIVFETDLDEGFSTRGVPMVAGRLLRVMQYHLHSSKDMVKGEKPRLIGWRLLDAECVCDQYDDHMHCHHRGPGETCCHCPCTCAPRPESGSSSDPPIDASHGQTGVSRPEA